MRIERAETFLVPPRWLFLRLETDTGVVGWGEPLLEGRAGTVRAAVHELTDLLLGAEASRIEDLWQLLSKGGFYRDGPILGSAVAGIDQALWDIAGKAAGQPVHGLLGGRVRDRIRMYTWIGGADPERTGEAARRAAAAGFSAIKMLGCDSTLGFIDTPASLDLLEERVAAVRSALGPDRDLAVDFHGRFSPAMARRAIGRLAPYRPLFVEEPVLPEFGHTLPGIVAGTTVPIATGERLFSRTDFRPALEAGIAVAQPDLSHAGGISEVWRIATMADSYGAALAPHCPLGPIALASCLQVDLASPNFLIQEQALGIEHGGGAEVMGELIDTRIFTPAAGHLPVPEAPGLGLRIDEAAVRRAAERGHRFRFTPWRHPDGSFAEM